MEISKGLVIDDPWIGYILDGSKTWEMRSSSASHRGWFGLIRKGTGTVLGIARLVSCGGPLSPEEMLANRSYHQIPDEMIRSGNVAKWNTPWKLADIRRLSRPVPYRHKPGAVTWVLLDETVNRAIRAQFPELSEGTGTPPPPSKIALAPTVGAVKITSPVVRSETPSTRPASSEGAGTFFGESVVTDGNLNNGHINLRGFDHKFPTDAIGGSNKSQKAPRELTIDWGGLDVALTDIDGTKHIFRSRAWVASFFKLNNVRAADRVQIFMVAPYSYRVRLAK